jgi:hypothetical protein
MIGYAATLYTGTLYAGLVIAVIFAAYLVLTARSDRRHGLADGTDQATEDMLSHHMSMMDRAGAAEEKGEEAPQKGAA